MTQVEETMQAERTERAQSEHFGFARVRNADGMVKEIWCHSFKSETIYVLTRDGACDCKDFQYRCAPAGLECKHIQAMRLAHRAGKIKDLGS